MPRVGHTRTSVGTANTNRDGSGTVVHVHTVQTPGGEFIDRVMCHSLGTNAATEGVVFATNGHGLADTRNNWILQTASLPATTLGTWASTDNVEFAIGAWLDQNTEIYCLVHATQSGGRQFVAYADPTYQRQTFEYTAL